MGKIREFQLFSSGPSFWTRDDGSRRIVFFVEVLASSLRQAIFLAANRKRLDAITGVGIVSVDHHDGPQAAEAFFVEAR